LDKPSSKTAGRDIRDEILLSVAEKTLTARIIAEDEGLVVGIRAMEGAARHLGLLIRHVAEEGSSVKPGDEIARFEGRPKQIVMAEEQLMGLMAKPSGIATATRRFVDKAGERPRIVSGAWKKMPPDQKEMIRRAVVQGGASCRMTNQPFLYLDKNYVRMLGGIRPCLNAMSGFNGYLRVVQIRGDYGHIDLEAVEAVEHGADIVFIDTGQINDLSTVIAKLKGMGYRERVKIAFGGGVQLEDLDTLKGMDVDILDIGRPIIDAPLLDMKMEVIPI